MRDGKNPRRGEESSRVRSLEDADVSTGVPGGSGPPSSGRGPLQLVALEAAGFTVFPLPESGSVAIGRGEDCAVRLNDGLVSRQHAVLSVNPLCIEDSASANGTRLGAERITPGVATRVLPGQAIGIGRSLLIVRRSYAFGSSELRTSSASGPTLNDPGIVVCDPVMAQLFATLERLAQGQINVLILGETGVGKEVVAETIHRASARRDAPLLRINCASLAESLLESELFGHERGAFTGACAAKPGLIELADGGTVFLDEVGELTPPLQAKLLRLIETRETTRIGGLHARRVDVRFLFATNRDLECEVREGRFRSDLYFRLKGAAVHVPPLRERASEILPLAEAYVTRAAEQMQLVVRPQLSAAARALLCAHTWPGNVRELRNAIERAVLLCTCGTIVPTDLALERANFAPEPLTTTALSPTEAPVADACSERERIEQALVACAGNQSRAAESLGMPRRTLVRKIAELGLPRPRRVS
jgi:two-component system, NtrC family, response regulator AtoC